MMQTKRTALVTGSSSGFGLLTSISLARRGWHVVATMRDPRRRTALDEAARLTGVTGQIEVLPLDVTLAEQIDAVASELAARPQTLDAVVNNAGFALGGFAEDVTDAELRRQFDTNFFAHVNVTRALLPQMRRQRSGHIVMVSSISGRVGFPGLSSYVASKHALEGWSESLRLELEPEGIHVSLVEPGSFATGIWSSGAELSAASRSMLEGDNTSPNRDRAPQLFERVLGQSRRRGPQPVADRIVQLLEDPSPTLRSLIGVDAHLVSWMRRLLPWTLYERLILKAAGLLD